MCFFDVFSSNCLFYVSVLRDDLKPFFDVFVRCVPSVCLFDVFVRCDCSMCLLHLCVLCVCSAHLFYV